MYYEAPLSLSLSFPRTESYAQHM